MFSGRVNRWHLLVPLSLIFLSGCVYFNTFFLAQKKFKEAEESQKKDAEQKQDKDLSKGQTSSGGRAGGNQGNIPPRGGGRGDSRTPQSPGQAFAKANQQQRNLYEDAIKKAGKVLSDHPNSKWADDALYLIGKSYFNMGDYASADRKFSELVTNHPKSKYAVDCYFCRALCQIELGNEDQAEKAFETVEQQFPKCHYIDEICFARGKMAEDDKDYTAAIGFFKSYLEKFSKDDSAALAGFHMGKCQQELGNYYDAYAAYSRVKNYNPGRRLEFESTLAAGGALLKTDSSATGMRILTDLAKDDRYFSQLSRIRLKVADGYLIGNDVDKSIKEYTSITTENPKSFESAEAYYRLGLIYQNKLFDIEKAKQSFTKAQTENPTSEYRNLALARSAQIAKFETYQSQLQKADSVRAIEESSSQPRSSTSPDSAGFIGPIDNARHQGTSEKAAEGDTALLASEPVNSTAVDTARVNAAVQDSMGTAVKPPPADSGAAENPGNRITGPTPLPDSIRSKIKRMADRAKSSDSISVDSTDADLPPFIGPLPENTAPMDSTWKMAKVDSVMGEDAVDQVDENAVRVQDSLIAEQDKRKVREDSIRQSIIESGIETRFLLAELYAYELNQTDSAYNEYRLIVEQYPTSAYAAKSLLAAASLKLNSGDSVTARDCLRQLIDKYPESPQASVAAEILKFPLDFSHNAVGIYARAESLAFEGDNPDSAAVLFGYIADHFPDLAPKAAFARAWAIDLAKNGSDSSAYYAYEEVSRRYPQSVYATAASERIGKSSAPKERKFAGVETPKKETPGGNKADTSQIFTGGLPPAPPVKVSGEFVYPQALLDKRLKGEVLFKIKINLFGKVEEHDIIGPSGEKAIDSSATAALLRTEFDTSKLDLSQLDTYFRFSIPFERPDINIFNDPYREEQKGRR